MALNLLEKRQGFNAALAFFLCVHAEIFSVEIMSLQI
jgi:hypothetical protein